MSTPPPDGTPQAEPPQPQTKLDNNPQDAEISKVIAGLQSRVEELRVELNALKTQVTDAATDKKGDKRKELVLAYGQLVRDIKKISASRQGLNSQLVRKNLAEINGSLDHAGNLEQALAEPQENELAKIRIDSMREFKSYILDIDSRWLKRRELWTSVTRGIMIAIGAIIAFIAATLLLIVDVSREVQIVFLVLTGIIGLIVVVAANMQYPKDEDDQPKNVTRVSPSDS